MGEAGRQTVRLSGPPCTLLATTSLRPRLVRAATASGRARLPGVQHGQVPVPAWRCCSRSVLPAERRCLALKQGFEPCSLPGEAGFPTEVSGSTGVANFLLAGRNTREVTGFVFLACSFLLHRTEWGHLSPRA